MRGLKGIKDIIDFFIKNIERFGFRIKTKLNNMRSKKMSENLKDIALNIKNMRFITKLSLYTLLFVTVVDYLKYSICARTSQFYLPNIYMCIDYYLIFLTYLFIGYFLYKVYKRQKFTITPAILIAVSYLITIYAPLDSIYFAYNGMANSELREEITLMVKNDELKPDLEEHYVLGDYYQYREDYNLDDTTKFEDDYLLKDCVTGYSSKLKDNNEADNAETAGLCTLPEEYKKASNTGDIYIYKKDDICKVLFFVNRQYYVIAYNYSINEVDGKYEYTKKLVDSNKLYK